MSDISYKIEKTESTYYLTVKKEKTFQKDEVIYDKLNFPFFDLLSSFKRDNIIEILLDCVIETFDLSSILRKSEWFNSFFNLFSLYIDVLYNNKRRIESIDYKYFDEILKYSKPEYIDTRLLNDLEYNREKDEYFEIKRNDFQSDDSSTFESSWRSKFEEDYDSVFINFLKELELHYRECDFKIKVNNSKVLEVLPKETFKMIEDEIRNLYLNENEKHIKELFSHFIGQRRFFSYNNNWIKKGNGKPIERHSLVIIITENHPERILRIPVILNKNPDLSKPNFISQSGKYLIKYLFPPFTHRLIYFRDGSLSLERNIFTQHKGINRFIVLSSNSEPILDSVNNKYSIFFDYCRERDSQDCDQGRINEIFVDVNVPEVKKVHLIKELDKTYDTDIVLELQHFNGKTGQFVPVLNEDNITCLIELGLFERFNINGNLIFQKKEIINEINTRFEKLKSLSKEQIHQHYIKKYVFDPENLCFSSDYIRDLEKTKKENKNILKDFISEWVQSYFVHELCHGQKREVLSKEESHQFVIPDTLEQENEELGRRTELIVYWYLQKYFDNEDWFYYFKNQLEIENTPVLKDIYGEQLTSKISSLFDEVSNCEIIWNNQSDESFKPYDFSIIFNNIEYKIEVKSTRGKEENVFYLSIKELEELLLDPDKYLILRLSFIKKGEKYFGIQFNEEFYGCFYKIKPETVVLVKKKLKEWKEYYKTESIRFKVELFEEVPDTYNENSQPSLIREPKIYDSIYWDKFDDFVQETYFSELDRIVDSYSEFPEVKDLWTEFLEIKLDKKFEYFL